MLCRSACATAGRVNTEHKMTGQLSKADILAYIRLLRTEKLGPVPICINDLVEHAEAPLQSVHLVLLELELAGRLTYDSGGQVCLDIND